MNNARKSGGALVLVMIVLLAFSGLSIGLFKLHETDALETVRILQADQAFWVAEAGLQRALNKLRTDSDYRDDIKDFDESDPYIETGSVGNGSYEVELWGDGSATNFFAGSLGTVQGASRRLRLGLTLSDFGGHALVSLFGGNNNIGMDGTIIGSAYTTGELTISKGTTISGTVYAENYADFDTGAALPEDGVLDLAIDTDYFTAFFDTPLSTFPPEDSPLHLSNGVFAVGSSIDVSEIIGPGTLVIIGDQTFGKDLVIGDDVTIIVDGDLKIEKEAVFGNNVTLFATGTMDLFKNALSAVQTGEGCAFLSLGDMVVKKEMEFNGIIFTEGSFAADMDLSITGTLITMGGYDLKKDATVTYDAGMIPDGARNDMMISTYVVQSSSWVELPVD
jgi:hypothetical protein